MSLSTLITTLTTLSRRRAVDRILNLLPSIFTQVRTDIQNVSGGYNYGVPELVVEGTWSRPQVLVGSPATNLVFYPGGNTIEVASGPWYGDLYISEHSSITSMNFIDVVGCVGDFEIDSLQNAVTLNASTLMAVSQDFGITYCESLEVIDFSSLALVGSSLYFYGLTDLDSISMPNLTNVGEYFTLANFDSLSSVDFPSLEIVGDTLEIYSVPNLIEANFPALKEFRYTNIYGDASLTTLHFPVLEKFKSFSCNVDTLEVIDFGSSMKEITNEVTIWDAALNEAAVDALLWMLVSLDGKNGTTTFTGNVTLGGGCSAPGESGLSAISILEGRGCSVSHN